MMASIAAGLSVSTPRVLGRAADSPKPQTSRVWLNNHPWRLSRSGGTGRVCVRPVGAVPDRISDKVVESIKNAEEKCSEDPMSGECVAAWDEVEELSAAASHARDREKESDPLETFCKDNPADDECRTYED